MKLVGYVRVSTENQVEEGLGLEVQRRALKEWAKRDRHRLVAIVADEGISGSKDMAERPGLAEALSLIEAKRAAGLVVYRLDRLARSLNVQEAALAHVWRNGGSVFALDAGEILQDDPEDPMRTAMRQMMGVFAQLERGMIAARLRAGRRLKAEKGGYAYGAPGFGFRSEDRELTPDETEQEALKLIRRLHGKGASVREIAHALEGAGFKPKRSETWNPGTLSRIIRRLEGHGRGKAA